VPPCWFFFIAAAAKMKESFLDAHMILRERCKQLLRDELSRAGLGTVVAPPGSAAAPPHVAAGAAAPRARGGGDSDGGGGDAAGAADTDLAAHFVPSNDIDSSAVATRQQGGDAVTPTARAVGAAQAGGAALDSAALYGAAHDGVAAQGGGVGSRSADPLTSGRVTVVPIKAKRGRPTRAARAAMERGPGWQPEPSAAAQAGGLGTRAHVVGGPEEEEEDGGGDAEVEDDDEGELEPARKLSRVAVAAGAGHDDSDAGNRFVVNVQTSREFDAE
jgi:hypothetical protein